jgi:transglutaminase-like putative cysteine protease
MTSIVGRVKQANARGAPEDSIALRVAVAVAAVVAAHAVSQQGVGTGTQQLVVLVGLPAAHAFSYRTRRWAGLWLKLLIAAGLLAALAQFIAAITQLNGNAAAVQVPLAEMFLWTMLMHSWDLPARRDLGFSLVSSLVLVGTAGTLAVSTWFALDLVVWMLAASVALVLMHASELADLPMPRARPGASGTGAAAVGAARPGVRPLRGAAWSMGAVLVVVGVIAAAAFAVIPAAGSARAFTFPLSLPDVQRPSGEPGGLVNPSLGDADPARVSGGTVAGGTGSGPKATFGYFGFSNRMDTAVRGRPDDTLVMRVRAAAPAFWRGQSFDKWDGRSWTSTLAKPTALSGRMPLSVGPDQPALGTSTERFVQTYYIEKSGPNMIFAATVASELYFADPRVYRLPDGSLRAGVLLDKGAVYTVVSYPPSLSEANLRSFGGSKLTAGLDAADAARYLELPTSTTQRVRDLAGATTAAAPSTIEKVRALESWLGANTEYSLDIPPLPAGKDAVDHFLFDEKVGFCEQIGSSLVVMLRSLGIPARLVVGYVPGERNPFTGLYEVRASDAHSWAEVWFPQAGWLPFDPTAKVPFAPGADEGRSAGAGSFGFLARRLPSMPSWFGSAVGGLAGVAVVASAVAGVVRLRRRRRLRAARSWAERWLDQLERAGRRRGRTRAVDESVRSYVLALGLEDAPEWRDAVDTVEREAFGPGADEAARIRAEQLVDTLPTSR